MSARHAIFLVGLAAAALQCLYIREYLAVFLGNELVVGLALAGWLAAGGAGSLIGARFPRLITASTLAALIVAVAAGSLLLIRASRLPFAAGEAIPPLAILGVLLLTEAPLSFLCGYAFGAFSSATRDEALYGLESSGNAAGNVLVYLCVLANLANALSAALGCAGLALICGRRLRPLGVALAAIVLLVAADRASVAWKYASAPERVQYGREGEIAWQVNGRDTAVMVNGAVYRATVDKAYAEQATHLPLAERLGARRALVILDRGQRAELARYPSLRVDCIESEPLLAGPGSRITALESYRPTQRYDVVLCGAGMPQSAAGGRYFSTAFYRRVAAMLSDSGVFAFTLPFSPNYLSRREQQLYDVILATLRAEFRDVWVVPGEGYTFMASMGALPRTLRPLVETSYLAPYILPGIDPERLAADNRPTPPGTRLNTSERPIVLLLGLQQWAEQYGLSLGLLALALGVALVASVILLPKSGAALSIGTSGVAAGVGSVGLMLLYQAEHGALYSHIALLLIALTCGFAAGGLAARSRAGGRVERLRQRWTHWADLVIGIYCLAAVAGLCIGAVAPAPLFLLANFVLGLLCGAQFVAERRDAPGVRYAADLLGGVFGTALAGTFLIPYFGALDVAAGVAALKAAAWVVRITRR
jgi:hypothetical protein